MDKVLIIFVAVTAAAVVIQMGILVALYVSVRKTTAQMETIALEVQGRALPMLDTSREILADAAPKLKEIASNLVETSAIAKAQAQRLNATVAEFSDRARMQVIRADEMLTRTLDSVEKTTGRVQTSVLSPVRHVNGIVHALSVGLGVFLNQKNSGPGRRRSADEQMFI